ncbi:MAG: hypothetical protein IRZ07_26840, partial [Microbispora sp.]|nr:hypothetical protein [Microbispora sp.]
MTARPAAGGGRWISVAPERLAAWIARFAERHGVIEAVLLPDVVRLDAADGAVAECHVPFPPLRPGGRGSAGGDERGSGGFEGGGFRL